MRISAFSMVVLMLVFGSCKKETTADPIPTQYNFDIELLPKSEVPENISKASGKFVGVYDIYKKTLSYTINFQGMTPTAAHFHKGTAKENGSVVINIATATFASPYWSTTVPLNVQQEADLLAGLWYVNVHSVIYGSGEVRGQLVPKETVR
jgi:CHRD domain